MTTTLSCSSSTSLCPHGDHTLGDQPRCRGDSCHHQHLCRGNQPGSSERPAVEGITAAVRRPAAQPLPPCVHCSAQHANQHAHQHANQHVGHGYPLNPPTHLSFPQHFNTHPQAGSALSKAASPAPYATMPRPDSAQDTPPWPLTPFPKLPISPQQLPPGVLIPAALLRGYILPSQPTPTPTPTAAQRQYRIPSPPPSLTLTHHPMV
ncbi:extensin-like [Clupea harengus]|uniref:Extensin-like n=1 Tax=Clupea harengus TaxID=7950 RepID=A0A6P8FVQ3_CLUHA|nr:extensin-like [Clupea harengus]